MGRPRVSGLAHRRQATMVKPVEVGSTWSVLRRWPLVWRLAAVATGVLPLCGAVCARRQPRFRLLSAPGVIAVIVTVIYSVHAISWLTPQSFGGLRIGSHLVKVVLRAFTNLAQVASVWLVALRGPRIADLVREVNRLVTTTSRSRHKSAGCDIMLLLTVVVFFAESGLMIWRTMEDPLAISSTSLPVIFMNFAEVMKMCRGLVLVSFFTFLMQVCMELFDDISADIERIVRPGSHPSTSSFASEPRVEQANQNKTATMSLAAVSPGDWAGGQPSAPSSDPSSYLSVMSVDRLTHMTPEYQPPPALPSSSAPALASLRARFVSAADLTATLSEVFAPPTVYYLAHTVLISMLVVAMSDSRPQTAIFVADVTLLSVRSALLVAVLCQGGQRLEEAARRPAELLLRHPPEDPAAAAEAARLVALVNWLRPAAAAPGVFSINRQLLGSTLAGYMTYMVVLVQMGV